LAKAKLTPGINPVKLTDFKAIDPDGLFLPAEPGDQEGFVTPFHHRFPSNGEGQNYHPAKDSKIWKTRGKDKLKLDSPAKTEINAGSRLTLTGPDRQAEWKAIQRNAESIRIKMHQNSAFREAIGGGALAYDSALDDEESLGLDSLEHAHTEVADDVVQNDIPVAPSGEDLHESAAARRNRYIEAASTAEAMAQFLADNPNGSYNGYVKWAIQTGNPTSYQAAFSKAKASLGAQSPNSGESELTTFTPYPQAKPEFDRSKATGHLAELLALADVASEEDLRLEPTVAEKYVSIWTVAYNCARGKSLKRHAFICGSAGVGKSFTLKSAIDEGVSKTQNELIKRRGSIGKSLSDVIAFLWTYKKGYVIVLDDCDGFLTNSSEDVINTLKAAMDPDDPTVSISITQKKIVARKLGLLEEDANPSMRAYLSGIHGLRIREARDEDIDDDEIPDDTEDESLMDDGDYVDDGVMTDEFVFESSIIFISNLRRAEIPEAIVDRCKVEELALSTSEIMERIREVLPELLKNETKYDQEELTWGKQNAYKWLAAIVQAEAEGATIATPSGGTIVPEIRVPITFRLFTDLVDTWLVMADQLIEGGRSREDAGQKMILPFITRAVLPALKGDIRAKRK